MPSYTTKSTDDAMRKFRAAAKKLRAEIRAVLEKRPDEARGDVEKRLVSAANRLFTRTGDPYIRGDAAARDEANALLDDIDAERARVIESYAAYRRDNLAARAGTLGAPEARPVDEETRQYRRELAIMKARSVGRAKAPPVHRTEARLAGRRTALAVEPGDRLLVLRDTRGVVVVENPSSGGVHEMPRHSVRQALRAAQKAFPANDVRVFWPRATSRR
jgi:hypothetical protein